MFDSTRYWLAGIRFTGVLVLAFLVLPLLALVPLSFNGSSLLAYPMSGWSWQWYEAFFRNPRWSGAIANSLVVGLCTVGLATPLGTAAALGLSMAEFRGKAVLIAVLLSPMILPTIIAAVGMYFFFAPLGLANSLTGLVLAHTALAVPFVVVTVSGSLHHLDRTLAAAAASLGAAPWRVFRRITLPLILPGIGAGAVFAFATSFDEVVVALMLTGPEQRTLPRELLSGSRESLDPTIMAVATVLILLATLLLLTMSRLQRTPRRP
jgi:putative spermidine/putrescine transport system permease protein